MLIKQLLNLFMICTSLLSSIIMAEESVTFTETEEKYELSICAIFKNEALYLKDWIEYHLDIGVDHFYLYNVGSGDCFEKTLQHYIKKNIVTLVNWPEALTYQEDNASMWALSTQLPAYENAVNFLARDETKWLVFLDIDEFLVLSKGSINDILDRYDQFPGIAFTSEFFDGAIYDTISRKALRKETYDITDCPPVVEEKCVAKMIFKPDLCQGFIWPPYQCRFKEFVSCIEVDQQELRVKRFINRNMARQHFGKSRELFDKVLYPILTEDEDEKRNRPIYEQIPKFLIKLGQIQQSL